MSICVLNNFKKENFYLDPFPHLIIDECLSWDLYKELESSININRIKEVCNIDGAGAYRYKFGKFKKSIVKSDNLLKEFMEYHTSPEFADKVLNIFDKEMNELYGDFYSIYKKENVFLRGHFPKTCPKKEAVVTDCQVVIHEPLPSDSTTRTVHIDCFKEIYFGLLYMKQSGDYSLGGNLELYRTSDDKALESEPCEIVSGRDYTEYVTESWSEYNKSLYSDFINHSAKESSRSNIVKSKVIPYSQNNFILALNSSQSIHGVSPREDAELDRVSINIIGERVGKKSNMFTM